MNRSIFHLWQPQLQKNLQATTKLKSMNLNFGPQHPAAHGVLRLILQLNGEIIDKLDSHIGLLHRGSEKLIENKIYIQGLPYFDRMDYVSMLIQEHAYCLAIESLINTKNYSLTFSQIRTLYDELTRLINHLLCISCHALDIGSMTPVFWAFEEREKLFEFYEQVSGARMHAAFYRPNEINIKAVTKFLLEDILEFSRNFFITLNEMHNILTYNKIWKQRLINIGVYSYETCIKYGLTGVMARSTGIRRDLRLLKLETYGNYYYLNFRSYIGLTGDSFDRFLIRMNEMAESINIITQLIYKIFEYNFSSTIKPHSLLKYLTTNNIRLLNKKNLNNTMENLINHFNYWGVGVNIPTGVTYQSVEAPKGEFGVTLLSDNTQYPFKCKIKSPSLNHLQFLPQLAKGHFLADLAALIGTIDIVFGEVDR